MNSEQRLLLGTVNADGRVDHTPVVVRVTGGRVVSWQPLGSCEPPATIPMRALLQLPSLAIVTLKKNP